MAFDDALSVGEVVVGQLLPRLDVPAGPDPDLPADDLAVAIGLASVVDESADIAAHHRVPHPPRIDREAPDFPTFEVLSLAPEALLVIDQLALIGDDACVLIDGFTCEDAPTVKLGSSSFDAG